MSFLYCVHFARVISAVSSIEHQKVQSVTEGDVFNYISYHNSVEFAEGCRNADYNPVLLLDSILVMRD